MIQYESKTGQKAGSEFLTKAIHYLQENRNELLVLGGTLLFLGAVAYINLTTEPKIPSGNPIPQPLSEIVKNLK